MYDEENKEVCPKARSLTPLQANSDFREINIQQKRDADIEEEQTLVKKDPIVDVGKIGMASIGKESECLWVSLQAKI